MNKLHFLDPAADWSEAIPIGNGYLGGMVFGRVGQERVQINEDSLWSGGAMERDNPDCLPHLDEIRSLLFEGKVEEAEKLAGRAMYATYPHMRHYQTLGDIWIDFPSDGVGCRQVTDDSGLLRLEKEVPAAVSYERHLDLDRAVGAVRYELDGRGYEREFFASHPMNVMVYRMKAAVKGTLNLEISLSRKDLRVGRGSSFCDGCRVCEDGCLALYGSQGGSGGLGFAAAVRLEAEGGRRFHMGARLILEGADEAVIYVTGRTTYRSPDPIAWCRSVLDRAVRTGYDRLLEEHVADYRKYYGRISLKFSGENGPDPALSTAEKLSAFRKTGRGRDLIETYFNFGRYLLISSSREGTLPANLQGVWNQDFEPAWGSKYTININTQMNYWMAEKAGLSELHMPLLEHLKVLCESGRRTARTMYGARGFCCHHNMDLWGDCAPQDNHMTATVWPMGGAWLCLHIWEHYEYTGDRKFLEEYFPIIREAVRFFVDYMVKNPAGEWVTGPSASPENVYGNEQGGTGSLCMGPSMDSQILRELFAGYFKGLDVLGLEAEERKAVEARLAGLPAVKIGRHGQIQEWQEDYEEMEIGHRHISQLFALYPGNQIRVDRTPRLAEAARVTLKRRLEHGGGHTGWSRAWIIHFWARLHDGKEAYRNLKALLGDSTLPNLMDNHPPFQIDGNFGGCNAILEMLVQDYGNEIWLLPALPEELASGSLKGLCTKCGAVLDLAWEAGRLKSCGLSATRDGEVTVRTGDGAGRHLVLTKDERTEVTVGI